MRFDEVTQRIVRIRRTLAPHLHVERTEEGIAFHGKLHETQAVHSRRHLPSGFVRRLRRRNEDHLGERQFLPSRLRDDKMPEMDGIEGAAHDADALLLLCHDLTPLPMRQTNATNRFSESSLRESAEEKERHGQRRRHAQEDDEDGTYGIVEIVRALFRRQILPDGTRIAEEALHSRTCPSP